MIALRDAPWASLRRHCTIYSSKRLQVAFSFLSLTILPIPYFLYFFDYLVYWQLGAKPSCLSPPLCMINVSAARSPSGLSPPLLHVWQLENDLPHKKNKTPSMSHILFDSLQKWQLYQVKRIQMSIVCATTLQPCSN